jgi:hypothetical protein
VPETGVYLAIHEAHRPVHEVVLRKEDVFPACAQCGHAVRFELVNREQNQHDLDKPKPL